MKVKIDSGKVLANLKKAAVQGQENAVRGNYEAAQRIMELAKQLAPYEDGVLKGSGYVTPPTRDGHYTKCEIGFGGPAAKYVVAQHEDVSLNHPGKNAVRKGSAAVQVGQAKFLQNAANMKANEVRQVIASYIKAWLAGTLLPMPNKRVPTSPWEGPQK